MVDERRRRNEDCNQPGKSKSITKRRSNRLRQKNGEGCKTETGNGSRRHRIGTIGHRRTTDG